MWNKVLVVLLTVHSVIDLWYACGFLSALNIVYIYYSEEGENKILPPPTTITIIPTIIIIIEPQ